jgi:CRISPR-associated protein Cmr6
MYETLLARRHAVLAAMGAVLLEARTTGPLTLHLARASALENAGICMHRIYGFVYLPGTSVKGMTRAYAETVWFPAQFEANAGKPSDDAEKAKAIAAWRQIEDVFGYSPGSDAKKSWKPKDVARREADDSAAAGHVVFHDAWPVRWPALVKDILNCHHPEYYRNASPPGDWEDPIPVYFLAVPAGETFQFALSGRGRCGPAALQLAGQWLVGALVTQGAGAKTNSGYGAFQLTSCPAEAGDLSAAADAMRHKAVERKRVAELAGALTLVTPAFFAGANQYGPDAPDGCDLRPATLRGQLRWWWRTMHAGFLDAKQLSNLEAAIWGDTKAAGAVRVAIENAAGIVAEEYNFRDPNPKKRFQPQQEFKREHALGDPPRKTSQGLFYASYGMDDAKDRPRRHVLHPGARWNIRLSAKPCERDGFRLTADEVLVQAGAALWLLCHFGACGSKARKGFGSLSLQAANAQIDSVEKCQFAAAALREKSKLGNRFDERLAQSPALGEPRRAWCSLIDVELPSVDAWQVMDHIGFAYQAVAQQFKHNREKVALGLPRKIHGPKDGQWLRSNRPGDRRKPQNARYASPVCIHVEPTEGGHRVRAIAFPAAFLPNLEESSAFLKEFLTRFEAELQRPLHASTGAAGESGGRARRHGAPRQADRPASAPTAPVAGPRLPASGDQVEAELLEERTKKGGWRARHVGTDIAGPVLNSAEVPADKAAGHTLTLIVHSANEREIVFNYPTDALLKRLEKSKQHQQRGGPRKGRPRR